MAWTQQSDKSTGDLVTALDWNTILANLQYLAAGNRTINDIVGSGDFTTTSTTFVNVDATAFEVDITISDDVEAVRIVGMFVLQFTSDQYIYLEITQDGSPLGNVANGIFYARQRGSAFFSHVPVTLDYVVEGLSAGTYTFRLQWRVSGGTGTLIATSSDGLMFGVEEAGI